MKISGQNWKFWDLEQIHCLVSRNFCCWWVWKSKENLKSQPENKFSIDASLQFSSTISKMKVCNFFEIPEMFEFFLLCSILVIFLFSPWWNFDWGWFHFLNARPGDSKCQCGFFQLRFRVSTICGRPNFRRSGERILEKNVFENFLVRSTLYEISKFLYREFQS